MNIKFIISNAKLALLLLCASCGGSKQTYDATGAFEATEITVSSEAAGKILMLDATEGQEVAAGTTVGVVDTVQLYLTRLQLMQQASSVRSNRPDISKQIAALQEQIAKQQTERARVENLLQAKAATQKQLDDITSAVAVLERQLAALRSSLSNNAQSIDAQSSALEIQIAQVDDRLAKCRITAPIAGTILQKYAEAGELAYAGRPLFKIADVSRLYLRAYLTLAQLEGLKIGQQVTVVADYGGDNRKRYDGAVAWISERSEFTPKNIQTKDDRANLVYAVKVAVRNDGYIKIGMYGELLINR